MFGVLTTKSTKLLCDNESVVQNSSKFESNLNRKHFALAYPLVCWAVAANIISIAWTHTQLNIANTMTKRLTTTKRESLYSTWTY